MATVAGTIYLNGCNYQLQYDILSQSVENNSTTVRLYGVLNVTNNYISWSRGSASVHYSSTGIGTYYSKGSYTLVQGDYTFTHDSNGNKTQNIGYSLSTTFVSGSSSADITFPHINRVAKTDSVTGNNVEGTFKVGYTKYINNYTYKLRISIPNVIALETIPYGTSNTEFTLSQETIDDIFERTKTDTSNSIKLGFAVETWNGGTQLSSGNEKIITAYITEANPIFNNFDFEDTNTTTVALTGSTTNNVINVNGYSNIQATIKASNKAQAIKGASMSKYRFSINGNTPIEINYSSDSNVSGTVNNSKDGIYNIYAIDSRNNSTLVTKQATSIISYEKITLDKQNCSFVRNDNQVGEYAILTINGTFWGGDFGQVVNSIKTATYKFKKSDSPTWIDGVTPIINDIQISGNSFSYTGMIASDNQDTTWDLDANYNLEVTISDELSSAVIDTLVLNSAVPTMSLDKNGVGIMCAYDSNLGGSLQVGGKRLVESSQNYLKVGNTGIVWGNLKMSASHGANTQTINLPITFKNDNYSISITTNADYLNHTDMRYYTQTKTSTSFKIGIWNTISSSVTCYLQYIVVGEI